MKLAITRSVCILILASLAQAAPAGQRFLFVTFKGEETPLSEQIRFALSKDGRAWSALNGGAPVLISHIGEQGARDPYLLRTHDNSGFRLIATDLSINRNPDWRRAVRAGSRSILVWESPDLVHWSGPRLARVADGDAGCAWAPEAIWDERSRSYLVFWSSTDKADGFGKHRIWAARTANFLTFSPPFVYVEKPAAVIDMTIVRDGAAYYRFIKDERLKVITMEASPGLEGPWREVSGFSLSRLAGYEGPAAYRVDPAAAAQRPTWYLLLDHYAPGQGYEAYRTQDLASGIFVPAPGFAFPFPFRHGCVLPISKEEYERLATAYPAPTAMGKPYGR